MPLDSRDRPASDIHEARRRFLRECGKFAAATPPVVTLLLASSQRHYAAAASAIPKPSSGGSAGGGTRTDYPNGSWIIRYPDGSYYFGRGTDGRAPPGVPPGLGG